MATAHFEVPAGAIDGTNKNFFTALPYRLGSVAVFRNGQLQTQGLDDGWVEADPSLGKVTLNEAPLVGDVIQIFYTEAAGTGLPAIAEEEVCPLQGKIRAVDKIRARLVEVEALRARIVCEEA